MLYSPACNIYNDYISLIGWTVGFSVCIAYISFMLYCMFNIPKEVGGELDH